MSSERARYAQLKELFLAAEELAEPAREEFLRASGADPSILAEVREMLQAAQSGEQLIAAAGEQVASAVAERLPERIGPYRILALLGEGGMGLVYEAEQQSPHRRIALKVLRPGSRGHLARIEQEAEALGRLQHEGIAHIYEAGRFEGPSGPQAYLAMELVRGVPLDRFASERALVVPERVELVARIAEAVHSAHRQGVVHRDLKPDNILVDETGHAKVLDFGIADLQEVRGGRAQADVAASARRSGPVVGTVAYMSPEQAAGAAGIDTASDVWSLGVVLFELLTGRRPHDLDALAVTQALERVQSTPPMRLRSARADLPVDLESAVAKALARDPMDRYSSAAAMAADLRSWLAERPVMAHPATQLYLLRKFARRNRTLVAGSIATLLALVLGIVFSVAFAWQADDERDKARALSYRMAVRSALQEAERGRQAGAAAILAEAPAELRGFEWHHTQARLQPWSREYELPAEQIGTLSYLPGDAQVVTATRNGHIAVVDLASGQVTEPYPCDTRVHDVVVHAGERATKLAATGMDGRIFEWDLRSGDGPLVLAGNGERTVWLAYAADGRLFSLARDRLHCWQDGRLRVVATFEQAGPFACLAVAQDGAHAVAVRGDRMFCWETASGRTWVVEEPKRPARLVLTPDGRQVVATTVYQNLRVRSVPELQRIDRDQGHVRAMQGLAVSRDGGMLASTSPDSTLTLYDGVTREVLGLATRGVGLAGVAFRSDGRELITADQSAARLCTWRIPLSPAMTLQPVGGNVEWLLWSPDGGLLVASIESGWMCAFDPATGEQLLRTRMRPYGISDDGMRLLVLREDVLHVWNLADGRLSPPETDRPIEAFQRAHGFHPASPYGRSHPDPAHALYAISRNTRVEVGTRSRDPDRILFPLVVAGEITAVRFDRRGQRLAAGTRAGGMQILGGPDWRSLVVIPPRIETWIMSLDFSSDGTRLAVGCHDNTVRLYDPASGELMVELRGHRSHVAAVQFSADGSRLASGAGDDSIRIWDTVPAHERRTLAARLATDPAHQQRRASLLRWRD